MKIARRRRKILGFPALLILLKHCFFKANRCFEDPKFSKFSYKLPPHSGGEVSSTSPPGVAQMGGKTSPPGVAQVGGKFFEKPNFPPPMGGKLDPCSTKI